MGFQRADITTLTIRRDGANDPLGVHFTVTIRDDATAETKECGYLIQGDELAALPASGAARRAAIIAIIKREVKQVFQEWVKDRQARVVTNEVRNVNTDLGTTQITNTDVANPAP